MMDNYALEFLVTLFFGMFGVHKFMHGDRKMGFIYLFTLGLFGVGWIIDLIKLAMVAPNGPTGSIFSFKSYNSIMGYEVIKNIHEGILPNIQGTNLILSNDEKCCYADKAYTFKDKTVTTGYVGGHKGVSIRLMKGVSYHTGGSGSKAVRQTTRTTYNGVLYITNKRIIYTSQDDSFDKTFDKITSINETKDGLIIQIGSQIYSIVVNTHREFMQVFNMVRQMNSEGTNN